MTNFKRPDHHDFLTELLSDLYSSKADADVKVVLRNQEVLLHRAVLGLVSPFWAKILAESNPEEVSEIILDESVDLETCSNLFELVYKGTISVSGERKERLVGKGFIVISYDSQLTASGKLFDFAALGEKFYAH